VLHSDEEGALAAALGGGDLATGERISATLCKVSICRGGEALLGDFAEGEENSDPRSEGEVLAGTTGEQIDDSPSVAEEGDDGKEEPSSGAPNLGRVSDCDADRNDSNGVGELGVAGEVGGRALATAAVFPRSPESSLRLSGEGVVDRADLGDRADLKDVVDRAERTVTNDLADMSEASPSSSDSAAFVADSDSRDRPKGLISAAACS